MSSELAKVIFRGYEKPEELEQQNEAKGEFSAMFNPEGFSVSNEFVFDDAQADGEIGAEQKPKTIAPKEFSFDLLIDGTGASGEKVDVVKEVNQFRIVTGFAGKEKRPFYLSITWGTFTIRCVLKKMEVKYSLFRNDGTPVRATIVAQLSEYKTPEQQLRENPSIAARVTKLVRFIGQESLDLLAHKNYGEDNVLAEFARENGLNSLKQLANGERLTLPSKDTLKKKVGEVAKNESRRRLSNFF